MKVKSWVELEYELSEEVTGLRLFESGLLFTKSEATTPDFDGKLIHRRVIMVSLVDHD